MQAYAACDDPEIRAVVRHGYGDLVSYVERVSGVSPEGARDASSRHGMLMNVLASMEAAGRRRRALGAARLLEGCK